MKRAITNAIRAAACIALIASTNAIADDDNKWKFKLGGLLQTDRVLVNDDLTPIDDDTDFRRARIKTQVGYGDWRVRADYEFGLAEGWRSAFVGYSGFRKQRYVVGNHVAPFSMEDLTGSRYLSLSERSIASVLSPGMLLGASWRTWRDRWSFHTGVYGDELSDLDRRKLPGTSGIGRITVAPALGKNYAVHLGLAAEYRDIDDGEGVRLRARPATRLTDVRLVDTRTIDGIETSSTIGAEFAWAYDRFKLQSEHTQLQLHGLEDLTFSSSYVSASFLIGGEPYSYRASRGNFRAAKPEGKWGALELTGRFATLDLTDGGIAGGQHEEMTIGISYIFNEYIRLVLTHSELDATPNRNGVDEDVSVTSLRLGLSL